MFIINEGADSLGSKSIVEMANKSVPSVTSPKAEKYMVFESIGKRRGRR
jgi:hypothetical protein